MSQINQHIFLQMIRIIGHNSVKLSRYKLQRCVSPVQVVTSVCCTQHDDTFILLKAATNGIVVLSL